MNKKEYHLDLHRFQGKLTFAFLVVLGCVTARFVGIAIHEILGHGLFAYLLGGSFYAVYISPFSGFAVLHFSSSELWSIVLIYAAGIIMQIVFGLVILLAIPKLKGFLAPFFALLLSEALLVHSSLYLGLGALFGGDFCEISRLTKISPSIFFIIGISLTLFFIYLISKRFLSFADEYLHIDSKKAAFHSLIIFWLTPLFVVVFLGAAATFLVSPQELIYMLFFVGISSIIIIILGMMISMKFKRTAEVHKSIDFKPIAVIIFTFLLVMPTWLCAFGLTPSSAHGLMIAQPPVEAEQHYIDILIANVKVTINSNLTIDVEVETKGLIDHRSPLEYEIWRSFEKRPHWDYYKEISTSIVEKMLNTSNAEIKDIHLDSEIWAAGMNHSNGRLCLLEIDGTNISNLIKINDTFRLTINDPWKQSGYLDKVNITWSEGVEPASYSTDGNNEPIGGIAEGYILWLNENLEEAGSEYCLSFEVMH